MELYSYFIKLIDPIFFAREGISGAFSPPYLHATALNHALAWGIGKGREDQPYFMTEENGGKNSPRYKTSWIDENFYLTPARPMGSVAYHTEIVKGDGDKNIQVGYGAAKINGVPVGKNEVLKAYRIYSIAPESEFEGYLYSNISTDKFPSLIRLGSFRGLAVFQIDKSYKVVGFEKKKYCDHPVDPLVNKVLRGSAVPMLPYPIVDQALVQEVWEIRKYRQRVFVAALPFQEKAKIEPVKHGASLII
jgi:CRISPR type I-D-associated protein Csc1